MEKTKKSICKLKLDIGVKITDVSKLEKNYEDLWMKVAEHFNYLSPHNLIITLEKDTYACKMYDENPENCKKCPAYTRKILRIAKNIYQP